MSEQGNVQVIQAAYAAFERGDIQSILDSLSERVEWIGPEVEPVAGTYRGRDEVGGFFRKVHEIAEFSRFEPREYVAQGDRVIALGSYRAKVRSTGRFYECDWAMAFTIDYRVSGIHRHGDDSGGSRGGIGGKRVARERDRKKRRGHQNAPAFFQFGEQLRRRLSYWPPPFCISSSAASTSSL